MSVAGDYWVSGGKCWCKSKRNLINPSPNEREMKGELTCKYKRATKVESDEKELSALPPEAEALESSARPRRVVTWSRSVNLARKRTSFIYKGDLVLERNLPTKPKIL